MLDLQYEAFCLASPVYYDRLHSKKSSHPTFATAHRVLPDGWRRVEQGQSYVFVPDDVQLCVDRACRRAR